MRRVVVTVLGAVSPLGCGVDHVWDKLTAGESGIQPIQSFDVSDLPAKIAGIVPGVFARLALILILQGLG